MRNYSPLAGFVSGFGTGYNFTRDNQRRDELEKQEKEKYETEKAARARDTEWQAGRERIRTDMTTSPVYQDVDGTQVEIGRRPKELGFKDNLKLIEDMAAHDFKYGKMPLMDYANAKDRVKTMKAEGMLDAHQAFVETGDIRKAAEKFNEAGDQRIDMDSLKAKEIDGPFGKHVTYTGQTVDGKPFQYDPVQAAALAGGAKGFLAMQEKGGEQRLKGEQTAAQAKQADAAQARADAQDRRAAANEDRVAAQDAHWQRMDEILRRKVEGSEKFAFKPSDQAKLATGIAARMQVIDNASGKKKDHEATSDAIGLASQVVRGSNGQIGLDEAVGLVANPDIWLTKEDAQKQAQRDYSRGSNTFGGFEVKDDKGKVVKKLSKDEYVKQRARELIDENRQEVRDRVEKYTGGGSVKTPQPIAARGLPTGSPAAPAAAPKGGRSLSPKAQSVLNDALQ
jgi:hypothetical protein